MQKKMLSDRERRLSGNWQNNTGANDYNFRNNSGNQANGNWAGKRQNPNDNFNRGARGGRGGGGGVGGSGGDESFEKFRDPNQTPSFSNRQQFNQHRFQDNNRRDHRKHEQRGGNKGRRNDKFGRNGKGGGNGKGGRGGGGRDGRHNGVGAAGPWYNDGAMPSDMFYFDNGQLGKEQSATGSVEQPIPSPVAGEAPTDAAPAIVMPVVEATAVVEKPAAAGAAPPAAGAAPPAFINAANIKKEKKDPSPKSKPAKPAESSTDSSSSSSDESVEAGEVVKKKETASAHKTKVKGEIAAKPAASSSSEEESDDDTPTPVKVKTVAKESIPKSSKTLKKHASEDDVVCLGKETRKFTIPDDVDDEEEASSEAEEQKSVKSKDKANHPCGICDKKGHTSFECQMICRNCSASYHSLKNCPNPPNLSIALQAFMEFTMQQLTVFNVDKRFVFPAGVLSTTPAIPQPAPPAVKSKKDKQRTSIKKSKKTPKKKLKIEKHDSDDDDEDDDDEDDDDDDDDEADVDAFSESESESESSSDPKPLSKAKRKRSSTKQAPNMSPAAAYPFPLLAAGSHYNPMMYPYAAPFNFPK